MLCCFFNPLMKKNGCVSTVNSHCESKTPMFVLEHSPHVCRTEIFHSLFLSFPISLSFSASISFHLITLQLQPKHCAETISAARHRKQKKPVPKKGEVQREKPGAESLRKDRTVVTKSAFLLVSLIITLTYSFYIFYLSVSDQLFSNNTDLAKVQKSKYNQCVLDFSR